MLWMKVTTLKRISRRLPALLPAGPLTDATADIDLSTDITITVAKYLWVAPAIFFETPDAIYPNQSTCRLYRSATGIKLVLALLFECLNESLDIFRPCAVIGDTGSEHRNLMI